MRRLTESVAGVVLLAATFIFGIAGLVADLIGQSDPPTLFGGAFVSGIVAIALTQDEHLRVKSKRRHPSAALFGRVLLALGLVVEVVALVIGLQDSPYRNLWFFLAIILALDGLAAVLDTHRLAIMHQGTAEINHLTDAVLGIVAAAVGLGFGVAGFVVGLFDNPHAPAWLYAGVVFALLANAILFDEHAHAAALFRLGRSLP